MTALKEDNSDGMDSKVEPINTHDGSVLNGDMTTSTDHLQRNLGNRQVQLIAIGGSIGTASFVSIGTGLYKGNFTRQNKIHRGC